MDYFKRVVALQNRYALGKKISNGFQTNGILLDDRWCDLFQENDFLVGLSMDGPARFHDHYRRDRAGDTAVTPWSVTPDRLAKFYIGIFDQWVKNDVGEVFIQFFDTALGNWMGMGGGGLCHFARTCGATCAIEHNGNVYSCDHYVYSQYCLGNIMTSPLTEIVQSEKQHRFSRKKRETLSWECLQCEVLRLCNGDCPKHRFDTAHGTGTGKSYFCSAYKKIFSHMSPYLEKMSHLLRSGRTVPDIMKKTSKTKPAKIKPNSPCPCGSTLKFKKCCGRKGRALSDHTSSR